MPQLIPFIPSIVGTIGGPFGNPSSSSSTPQVPAAYQGLQGQVLQMIQNRLKTGTDLSGYTSQGTQNINHTFDLLKQSSGNDLTARGLSTSPVAATVDATGQQARGGQIAQFENSIPLVQRDMQNQDLGLAGSILRQNTGTTSTGSTGGGVGGALTNLSGYLGYLQGKGAFPQLPGQNPNLSQGGGFIGPTPGNPNLPYQPPTFSGWG